MVLKWVIMKVEILNTETMIHVTTKYYVRSTSIITDPQGCPTKIWYK